MPGHLLSPITYLTLGFPGFRAIDVYIFSIVLNEEAFVQSLLWIIKSEIFHSNKLAAYLDYV